MVGLNRRDILASIAGTTVSGVAPAAFADPTALSADIDLLQRIYETLHPGLYRYQTPLEFRQWCAQLKADLAKSIGRTTQYLLLSRLLSQVRCGHSYGNFYNQSKAVAKELIAPANKLPFHFTWIGAHMLVSANPLAVDGVSVGDEIVAINGEAPSAIQARLLPYIRADGSNDDKRRKLLSVTGSDRIETFDVFYPLLFPVTRSKFQMSLRAQGSSRLKNVELDPIDQTIREKMMSAGNAPDAPDYWTLTWPAQRTALVTMPGWAMYDVKWDWRARIKAFFEEIAKKVATGLVIDLRDNEGGNDCGNEMISYLIDQDLHLNVTYERRVRFRSTPDDLNRYLDTWDRSFEHLGEGADDLGNGFFRLRNDEDEVAKISPKGPRFRGKVIVLSSAQNSSATFQFIDLMRRSGLARIYGQPTGGNQRGINGGCFFFVRLPNSGLEVDLPLIGNFPREPKPDAGLQPDVRIDPSIDDVATGYDRVLKRALNDLA